LKTCKHKSFETLTWSLPLLNKQGSARATNMSERHFVSLVLVLALLELGQH
jgi:hypothetical protein